MSNIVYGYVRVSPSHNGERDVAAQKEAISRDWYARYQDKEEYEWGGFVEDNTSGEVPFANRAGGMQLVLMLEKGDVIVFSKIDRGFRDFVDLLLTTRKWDAMGITARFLDMNLDTATPMGRMLLQLLGMFAEWEKARIRERTKETMAIRKLKGMAVGRPPYGWKCQGGKGARKLVPWPEQRQAARRIIELTDIDRLTWQAVWMKMQAEGWPNRLCKRFGWQACRNWYFEERALQEEEAANGQDEETPDSVSG